MKKNLSLAAVLCALTMVPALAQQATAPQSTAASKTAAFGTVLPADPVVVKALDAKDLLGANKLVGKPGAFVGTVSKVYVPKDNGTVILDFAPHYKEAITATLKPAQYPLFPDMKTLEGKKVLLTGKVGTYQGRAQIDLLKPDQIKIVPQKP